MSVGAVKKLALAAACGVAASCATSAPPPEPGQVRGFPPDLTGRRVILLPVQTNLGVLGDLDAELAFGLQDRGGGVDWVLPAEVDAALERSPAIQARTHGLPVGSFTVAEVDRVGDPLYGNLRRMSALVNAELVMLPVQAAVAADEYGDERIQFWTTLIDVRTGFVMWFAVLEGESYPRGDPRALASAVEEVARTLLWHVS